MFQCVSLDFERIFRMRGNMKHVLFHRMIIPKANRVLIYEQLFKDGVMVAIKDFNAPKHKALESVPNLQVIKAMLVSICILPLA